LLFREYGVVSASVPIVAVIRDTMLLTDAEVASWCAAMRIAVTRDFAPHWSDAMVGFVKPGDPIPVGAWQLWFRDHTDQDGALGYHDDNGLPIAHVFVADDLANGTSWTVTGSHEFWEMLGNPAIDRFVENVADGVTWRMPVEVADCCEDDQFAYAVTGSDGITHQISAFALPSWFDPNGAAPFTFPPIKTIDAPFMLADGGYIGRIEVAPAPGQWTQFMAARTGPRQVKQPWSRTRRLFGPGADAATME
jgi:hypothetical protein